MTPHLHGPDCHPHCNREVEVDERSVTGAHRIVTRRGYGRRPGDKPRWWPFAFHAYKAVVQVVTLVAIALIVKHCGIPVALP